MCLYRLGNQSSDGELGRNLFGNGNLEEKTECGRCSARNQGCSAQTSLRSQPTQIAGAAAASWRAAVPKWNWTEAASDAAVARGCCSTGAGPNRVPEHGRLQRWNKNEQAQSNGRCSAQISWLQRQFANFPVLWNLPIQNCLLWNKAINRRD